MSGPPSPRREKRVRGRGEGSFPEQRLVIEPNPGAVMKISMAVCRMSPRVTSARKSDRTASELGNKFAIQDGGGSGTNALAAGTLFNLTSTEEGLH